MRSFRPSLFALAALLLVQFISTSSEVAAQPPPLTLAEFQNPPLPSSAPFLATDVATIDDAYLMWTDAATSTPCYYRERVFTSTTGVTYTICAMFTCSFAGGPAPVDTTLTPAPTGGTGVEFIPIPVRPTPLHPGLQPIDVTLLPLCSWKLLDWYEKPAPWCYRLVDLLFP
jgi:hypothetical protein